MKLSNKFTLARLLFAPVFFALYNIPLWVANTAIVKWSAFLMVPLVIITEFTDFFDGYFARKRGEVGDFGKLFDPFADVVLNLTLFMCLTRSVSAQISSYVPLAFFALLFYREFSMIFLRMVAACRGVAIAARKGGKLKTVTYIVSCVASLLVESFLRYRLVIFPEEVLAVLLTALRALFLLCVILSYASFIDYIRAFWRVIKKE